MNSLYLNLLALNNIIQVLTFDERVFIRKKLLGNLQDVENSERIIQLLSLVKAYAWERPHVEYRENEYGNKILYYYDEETESYNNIDNYKHPILEEAKTFNITEKL